MDEENPFTLGDVGGEDEQLLAATAAAELEEAAPAATAERSVEGLVPLCALHGTGPHLQSSVFGYDIAQMAERPWAAPGANLSDYFNYGFNEDSWRAYCQMQSEGPESLQQKAQQYQNMMKSMEGAMYGGGGPAPPQPSGGIFVGGSGSSSLHKTRLCQKYQEGRCTRGDQCTFAHGANDLRAPPGGSRPYSHTDGGSGRSYEGSNNVGGSYRSGGPGAFNPMEGGVLSVPPNVAPLSQQGAYQGPGRFVQPPTYNAYVPPPADNSGSAPVLQPTVGFRMPQLRRPPADERKDDVFEPSY